MDTQSKILISALVVMSFLMLGFNYQRIFTKGNYIISMEVECDPMHEVCLTRTLEDDPDTVIFYKTKEGKASEFRDE